jgi:hypothetical protein
MALQIVTLRVIELPEIDLRNSVIVSANISTLEFR